MLKTHGSYVCHSERERERENDNGVCVCTYVRAFVRACVRACVCLYEFTEILKENVLKNVLVCLALSGWESGR